MITIRTQDRMALYKCSEIFIEELTNYTKLDEFVEKRYEQEEKPIILLVSSFGNKIKREITKAEYISIKTSEFKTKFRRYVITGNEHILGKYEEKERALQVLDEIQKAIRKSTIALSVISGNGNALQEKQLDELANMIVYEMQKE